MGDHLLKLYEGEEQAFQWVFEVWIAAIALFLMIAIAWRQCMIARIGICPEKCFHLNKN